MADLQRTVTTLQERIDEHEREKKEQKATEEKLLVGMYSMVNHEIFSLHILTDSAKALSPKDFDLREVIRLLVLRPWRTFETDLSGAK